MELRQLRHFLAVLKCGSINRAAATLNVTQPSLSHSIKALERSVGAELLLRSGGGIRPTAIGVVFERYAQNILRETEKAKSEVTAMRGAGAGKLVIGALSVFIPHFIPKVIGKFLTATSGVDIEAFTFTYNSDIVIRNVQSAEWDLALTLMQDDFVAPSEVNIRLLGNYPSSVYCSAVHPLATVRHVSLEQMASADWVVTNSGGAEDLLRQTFAEIGMTPKIRMRVNSMNFVMSATRAFPFLCLAPLEAVAQEVKDGRMVKVDQTSLAPSAQIALLHSNLAERTSAMRDFMAHCAEHAATLLAENR